MQEIQETQIVQENLHQGETTERPTDHLWSSFENMAEGRDHSRGCSEYWLLYKMYKVLTTALPHRGLQFSQIGWGYGEWISSPDSSWLESKWSLKCYSDSMTMKMASSTIFKLSLVGWYFTTHILTEKVVLRIKYEGHHLCMAQCYRDGLGSVGKKNLFKSVRYGNGLGLFRISVFPWVTAKMLTPVAIGRRQEILKDLYYIWL